MNKQDEKLRAVWAAASNSVDDWITRCEAVAIDVRGKHGEATTWPGYAQAMDDKQKPEKVRQAAGIQAPSRDSIE